jgi:hypothetical protein
LNCVRLEEVANSLREERSSIVLAAKRYRSLGIGKMSGIGPASPSEAQSIVVRKGIRKPEYRSNKVFNAAWSTYGLKRRNSPQLSAGTEVQVSAKPRILRRSLFLVFSKFRRGLSSRGSSLFLLAFKTGIGRGWDPNPKHPPTSGRASSWRRRGVEGGCPCALHSLCRFNARPFGDQGRLGRGSDVQIAQICVRRASGYERLHAALFLLFQTLARCLNVSASSGLSLRML